MHFTLPKPPSTNHIYGFTSRGGYARSYITEKGKNWFEECSYKIAIQTREGKFLPYIATPLNVTIHLHTNKMTQDIDGIIKPTLDLLQKTGMIDNDRNIMKLQCTKTKCDKSSEHIELIVKLLE